VPFCVVITDHHPPSKNGKYTLVLTEGVEESGINLSVANSLYGSGIEPEYEPLINPEPVYSITSEELPLSIDHNDWENLVGNPSVLNLNWIVFGLPLSKFVLGTNEDEKWYCPSVSKA
jgi:hypothetical protein